MDMEARGGYVLGFGSDSADLSSTTGVHFCREIIGWLNLVREIPYIKYYTPKGGYNLTL